MYKKGMILGLVDFLVFINYFVILIVVLTGISQYSPFGFARGLFRFGSIIYPLISLVVLLIFKVLLDKKLRYKRQNIFKIPGYYLILSFLLFNLFVVPVVLERYYGLNLFNPHDFCARIQPIFNTFQGYPLRTSVMPWIKEVNFSVFGDHFFPFLFCLIPFCFLFRSPESLIILQTLFLSASIFPLYLIAKNRLKNAWLGLAVCICFLLYPLTIKLAFYDFRLEYFAVFFIFWAFYFLEKNSIKGCILFLFLTVMCKENLFLISAFFGIYIFLFKNTLNRNRWIGFFIFIVSLGFLGVYVKIIAPVFTVSGDYSPFASHYKDIKYIFSNMSVYIPRILNREKLEYYYWLLKTVVFLPFLSKEIILVLPGILQGLLSDLYGDAPNFVIGHIWHNTVLLPPIFIGFVYGLGNLFSLFKLKQGKGLAIPILILIFSIPVSQGVIEFNNRILEPFKKFKLWNAEKPRLYQTLLQIKNSLPRDRKTVVHLPLFSLFCDFSRVTLGKDFYTHRRISGREKAEVEYAIYSEKIYFEKPFFAKDNKEDIKALISEGGFKELLNIDGFVVMKREAEPFIISFAEKEVLDNLEFVPSNSKVDYETVADGLMINLEFDGGSEEDEYLRVGFKDIDIPLAKYSWLTLEYELEDKEVQTIELVIGIDTDGDGKADLLKKGLYPYPASQSRDKFVISLYDILQREFRYKENYNIIGLEIYPHKLWGVDCSAKKKKYKFILYNLKLY